MLEEQVKSSVKDSAIINQELEVITQEHLSDKSF